jgi:hypothetical protein
MRVFAQHGHQPSDKIARGLTEGQISGAIFSARCVPPEKASERLHEALAIQETAEILLDPEFFASRMHSTSNSQLGYLETWGYLRSLRRRDLVRSEVVEDALAVVYSSVRHLPVTAHIAPNIYISQSFDSMEAGIALNFIERSTAIYEQSGRPVFATLAVDRRVFLNASEFLGFLNELTALRRPPQGFYLLVGAGPLTERSDSAQSEIIDSDVIAGWMMLNYALRANGFRVINGFADILTPFLAVSGADACATGWWTNLRTFSMGRYVRAAGGGGQPPLIRYYSKLLLGRLRKDELSFASIVPEILNRLPLDAAYEGETGRTDEALQTWEALASLNSEIVSETVEEGLSRLGNHIRLAAEAYSRLSAYGISGRYDTAIEYLQQLTDGISNFRRLAELS